MIGQSPEDIAQNAANAQNPAIVAARAALSLVIDRGARVGYDAEWNRESDAAFAVWVQALHDFGDHRLCYPHHCAVVQAARPLPARRGQATEERA